MTKILKKRFGVFVYMLALIPVLIYALLYISKNNDIKSLSVELDKVKAEQQVLRQKLKDLKSEYNKAASYKEVVEYASSELKMSLYNDIPELFVVVDKHSVFLEKFDDEKPDLNLREINLAFNSETRSDRGGNKEL